MAKVYYIKSTHRGHETIWEGTIEHFSYKVFGYTLECGHGWNSRINLYPKTIKSLVNALNKSAYECRHYGDFYEVSTKEEFDSAENARPMSA